MEIPNDLIDCHARGRLALFVGADLSMNLTGLPSRHDLIRILASKHQIESQSSLMQIAQLLTPGKYSFGITYEIKEALETTGKRPQPFHRTIAELGAMWTITTSYDDLLFQAFREVHSDWPASNHLVSVSDLSFLDQRKPVLLQLYGITSRPETLVLTEDDHYQFVNDPLRRPLVDELHRVLREYRVLFIGSDLSDPDFRLLWSKVLSDMGRFSTGAWAVLSGKSENEKRVWADRNIRIIDAEPMTVLKSLAGEKKPSISTINTDRFAKIHNAPESEMTSLTSSSEAPEKIFSVFLCHNSEDKPVVKRIGQELIKRGITPWLDEWELRPGFSWQRILEQQIPAIPAAAVFVGNSNIGPWQQMELDAFLREFVKRGQPVIPVILPDCNAPPKLPPFLTGMTWVDFRKTDPDPMKQLIWGITGQRV